MDCRSSKLIYHKTYRGFWDFKTMVLHAICVSGTVEGPLLTKKSPCLRVRTPKPWKYWTLLVIFA